MIRIVTGFQLNNEYEALDSRTLYETVQDMANATQGIYEGCIAYVKTGNEKGLYEEVELNNKKYVFTPIGILSFNCGTEEANGIKTLTFNLDNIH